MASPGRWPRDAFAAAVWSSDLTTTQRIVALAYADHAGDSDPATAWVNYDRLMHRTGLGRTALASAMRALVSLDWLVVDEPARQHRSARYRLTIPQQFASRTPQQFASRTTEAASSSPRGASSSPRGASSSPAAPDCSSDLTTDHNNLARAQEVDVIVQPEDREPHSGESLSDRIRGQGVEWTDYEIAEAMRRLTRIFGDDAAATTPAVATLMALASRRKPIHSIGAWLASQSDEQVAQYRPAVQSRRRPAPTDVVRPVWCGSCYEPTRRLEHPDDGRDQGPCPHCHPASARRVRATANEPTHAEMQRRRAS